MVSQRLNNRPEREAVEGVGPSHPKPILGRREVGPQPPRGIATWPSHLVANQQGGAIPDFSLVGGAAFRWWLTNNWTPSTCSWPAVHRVSDPATLQKRESNVAVTSGLDWLLAAKLLSRPIPHNGYHGYRTETRMRPLDVTRATTRCPATTSWCRLAPRWCCRTCPPPRPSSDVRPPPRPSSDVRPPPRPSSDVRPPPRPSSDVRPPPRPSSDVRPPPRPSSDVRPPPRPSSDVRPPPRPSSSDVRPPPRPSSDVRPPPRPSSDVRPPPRPSSDVRPPPRPSSDVRPPPTANSDAWAASYCGRPLSLHLIF
ncbi:hypothetical protein ACJJTC_005397 [Scirpophaga incertulas]